MMSATRATQEASLAMRSLLGCAAAHVLFGGGVNGLHPAAQLQTKIR